MGARENKLQKIYISLNEILTMTWELAKQTSKALKYISLNEILHMTFLPVLCR